MASAAAAVRVDRLTHRGARDRPGGGPLTELATAVEREGAK